MAITQVKSKQQFLVTDDVNFQTKKITNLADPVSAQDAATKAYVDAVKQALDIKDSVRAATTANITLSGAQTIDGVSVVAGDRVLVKDQSTASQNGIYVAAANNQCTYHPGYYGSCLYTILRGRSDCSRCWFD